MLRQANHKRRRFVLNDSYRSDACLLYPPHVIAIAAIYLAFSLHMPANLVAAVGNNAPGKAAAAATASDTPAKTADSSGERDVKKPRLASGQGGAGPTSSNGRPAAAAPSAAKDPQNPASIRGKTDPITFLASLNVDMDLTMEVVQELVSLYALWHSYEDAAAPGVAGSADGQAANGATAASQSAAKDRLAASAIFTSGATATGPGDERVIKILQRMRADRDVDIAHPAGAGEGKR